MQNGRKKIKLEQKKRKKRKEKKNIEPTRPEVFIFKKKA